MRALIGLALVATAGLAGLDHRGWQTPSAATVGHGLLGIQSSQSVVTTPAAPNGSRGVVQTVAALEGAQLPLVTAAPGAPRAEPIKPIIEPMAKPAPKLTADGKTEPKKGVGKPSKRDGKSANSTGRSGFKLTCTANQKLDVIKQKCIAVKKLAASSGAAATGPGKKPKS